MAEVLAEIAGDALFPAIDAAQWHATASEDHPADERHAHPFRFVTLRRCSALEND
ncbi:MAG: dihydrofolate reductase [Nevskia sp.]|nr:dihydrofolate reductase [Nevskia sp.]